MSSSRKFKIHICTCKIHLYIAQIFTGGNFDALKVFHLYTQIYPIFIFKKCYSAYWCMVKVKLKNCLEFTIGRSYASFEAFKPVSKKDLISIK